MKKLDKRIQKVTDIKTPFSEDFEELSNYIGSTFTVLMMLTALTIWTCVTLEH